MQTREEEEHMRIYDTRYVTEGLQTGIHQFSNKFCSVCLS